MGDRLLRIAARAPNHLGDGVMAMPALSALARRGEVTVYAPHWGADLYRDLPVRVRPRGRIAPADLAVLFPPSIRAAWESRRCHRRIGTATDLRGWLLTDVVPQVYGTARQYQALAHAAGVVANGKPSYVARPDEVCDVPAGHVGLVPVSASGAVREWGGFRALADAIDRPVVFYGGPGEDDAVARVAGPHLQRVGLRLPDFAAALQRCAVLVGNDSGAAHFGRACGVPVVTIFGSTTASATGAPGAIAVEGPALPCRPCYGARCHVGDRACLEITVDVVREAVTEVLDG